MNAARVELSPRFLKELERLERKYPRSLDEVSKLVEQLKTGSRAGDKIPRVGHDVYKVRLINPGMINDLSPTDVTESDSDDLR